MAPARQGRKQEQDRTLAILAVVFAVIMPPVGLILSLIAKDRYPEGADGHELVQPALILSIILFGLPLFFLLLGLSLSLLV